MIKIRALGTRELKQVLGLLAHTEQFEYGVLEQFRQLYVPMHRLSLVLPPKHQFLPGIFVAIAGQKVLGLIWLSPDGGNNRWKIDQLLIDPNESTYDVGTQLVNYVVNRYGGEGVQTFLALVDARYDQALGLLKTCGFRHCTQLHTFRAKADTLTLPQESLPKHLRLAQTSDAQRIRDLHSDTLMPEVRFSLERTVTDFKRPLSRRLAEKARGQFFRRWVVEDPGRDVILGCLDVITRDYSQFYLEMISSDGWANVYPGLLQYGVQHVLKTQRSADVVVQAYDFQKSAVKTLEDSGFQWVSTAQVLVKDYWIPREQQAPKLTSPILLFAGGGGKTSPA
jgi:hypothetical protein